MTITEKLACIEEVKNNILNAFRDSAEELTGVLEDVERKLVKYDKLVEMTTKKSIEGAFVAYLAMSLAGKVSHQNDALDLISILSPKKPNDTFLKILK